MDLDLEQKIEDEDAEENVAYNQESWRTFNRYTFYTYLIGLGMVGFLIGCISIGG